MSMGELTMTAGIAIAILGAVLFILQARRMGRQRKKDEETGHDFQMTELSGNTVPIQGETVQSVAVLEDTKGFD